MLRYIGHCLFTLTCSRRPVPYLWLTRGIFLCLDGCIVPAGSIYITYVISQTDVRKITQNNSDAAAWWTYSLVVGSIFGLIMATLCCCGSFFLCIWLTHLALNKREREKTIMEWRHRDEDVRARALGLHEDQALEPMEDNLFMPKEQLNEMLNKME